MRIKVSLHIGLVKIILILNWELIIQNYVTFKRENIY